MISIYILSAWLLLGATFLFPQRYQASRLLGGSDILGYGWPLQFYASATGVPAQVSIGFLLLDLVMWLVIVFAVHFLYRNLVRKS